MARRLFNAQKAGHTGSLDPLATGVLPVCFGEATKFSQYLLDADKAYRSTFVLGVATDTCDADGEVLEQSNASAITEADVLEQLSQFKGLIRQVPPMYSALKVNGQPLYKLARKGVEIERLAREVTVYELILEAFRASGAQAEVDVLVRCSKGTYIRSIAEGLGVALGVGAHVKALRRVAAGPFEEGQAVTLQELEARKEAEQFEQMDALLIPVDVAVEQFPAVRLPESSSYYVMQGQPVQVPHSPTEGLVRIYSNVGAFLGIGEILDDGRIGPKRLIATH